MTSRTTSASFLSDHLAEVPTGEMRGWCARRGLPCRAELLGQFQQPDLRPDDLLVLCHAVVSVAADGRATVPDQGENRVPPTGSTYENQQRMSD